MFRKDLIEILLSNPMAVSQIARLVDESPGRVADDLNHLFRSLKHTEYKAVVEPARCRSCVTVRRSRFGLAAPRGLHGVSEATER